MSRVQLALNVPDLDEAVDFYRRMFGTEPAKRRPGYANFAIAEPPLKLVLFEQPEAPARLNHLGVEVTSAEEVAAASRRLADEGFATAEELGTECCYARQDKVWVTAPDGPWEIYTVLDDTPTMACGCGTAADDAAPEVMSASDPDPAVSCC